MTTTQIISVTGLTKRFGTVQAVNAIDFSVSNGELFGFLGPNGAGKTTTINMLTGLARPDSGTITIDGIDCTTKPGAAQHLIGVVPDESNLYPELTGFENLCFCGSLYGMRKLQRCRRAEALLDTFNLTEAAQRKFGGYSKGMKRKLTIAAGIMHSPKILFLDEPTTGIDVASARYIRTVISDLHARGTTIFLTTHYIEEAERLCDRIAFIVDGKIVRIDSLENLIQPIRDRHLVQFTLNGNADTFINDLSVMFPDLRFLSETASSRSSGLLRVEAARVINVGPLVRFFEERGMEILEARRLQSSLEDVFIDVTGVQARDMRKEKSGGKR